MPEEKFGEVRDCKVIPGESVAKQHRLIVGTLTLKARKRKAMKAKPSIKWWKLREEEFHKKYREVMRQKLNWTVKTHGRWLQRC